MSLVIFCHSCAGSPLPLMMDAWVTPQNCQTLPMAGTFGIGWPVAPTLPKPWMIGSLEALSNAAVSAGGRAPTLNSSVWTFSVPM